jgi:hypothetical protein
MRVEIVLFITYIFPSEDFTLADSKGPTHAKVPVVDSTYEENVVEIPTAAKHVIGAVAVL